MGENTANALVASLASRSTTTPQKPFKQSFNQTTVSHTNIMPTIKQILAEQKVLIPENAALARIGLPNSPEAATWLRSQLTYERVEIDGQRLALYRQGELRRLSRELSGRKKMLRAGTGWQKYEIQPWD
jgi:hypothetical protein